VIANGVNLSQLSRDVSLARRAGESACSKTEDSGSMSADMVFIPTGSRYPIKRRSEAIRECLDAGESNSKWWRGYLLTPSGNGVASARLASAEAMADALKAWGAMVFYQRD
jgi:hypothetical protein